MIILVVGLLWAAGALAQTTLPSANAGFDITGFIQEASLFAGPTTRAGSITVNGIKMIVPQNSIVQMPAAAFSWPDLFNPAVSAPVGTYSPARPVQPAGRMGLAQNDPVANFFPSYEVRAVGNIITNETTGTQQYIVAMILPAAQQGLNGQSGYINYIDYTGAVLGMPGRFRVGGTIGNSATGTLCELNDPMGRFGAAHSPDQRFQCDWNNPTITTATGYPCGIPTVAPTATPIPPGEVGDPDRPYFNRPPNGGAFGTDPFLAIGAPLKFFTMPASAGADTTQPDPYKQVPLMVGDWIDFSGTLLKINPAGPNTAANMFVSVHSLTAHLGIKTTPKTNPAYIRVEELLFGVGNAGNNGPTVQGIAQETSTRAVLVAFCTDDQNIPSGTKAPYPVGIYGVYNPPGGPESLVEFPNGGGANNTVAGSPNSNPDELQMDDPVRGRIRLQLNKNENPPKGSKVFVSNAAGPGNFYREYIVKLNEVAGTPPGRQVQLPPQANGLAGLIAGQYRLPIFDYIFGEGTNFGEPWPPFNFQDFGFLINGEGNIGPLNPFPAFQ
jgi:hypothetical protein